MFMWEGDYGNTSYSIEYLQVGETHRHSYNHPDDCVYIKFLF